MNCYDDNTLDQILMVGILLGGIFTTLGFMLKPIVLKMMGKSDD